MDLHEIKRNYFRISVKGSDAVSVKINNIPYEVIGLNDGGIGIRLSSEDILVSVGDELPLELTIKDMVQSDLKLFERDKMLKEGGHRVPNFNE